MSQYPTDQPSAHPNGSALGAVPSNIDEITILVGRNLRRLRTKRGHTMERLAKISGVSRAMLGQIETGKSIPSISILWRIAGALDVPFATLMAEGESSPHTLLRKEDAKILVSTNGKFSSRALFPFVSARKTEFYELKIQPCHTEHAEAHAPGTYENLFVSQGTVEISLAGRSTFSLDAGDAILFEANVRHHYKNLSDSEAVIYLVMTHPETIQGS